MRMGVKIHYHLGWKKGNNDLCTETGLEHFYFAGCVAAEQEMPLRTLGAYFQQCAQNITCYLHINNKQISACRWRQHGLSKQFSFQQSQIDHRQISGGKAKVLGRPELRVPKGVSEFPRMLRVGAQGCFSVSSVLKQRNIWLRSMRNN